MITECEVHLKEEMCSDLVNKCRQDALVGVAGERPLNLHHEKYLSSNILYFRQTMKTTLRTHEKKQLLIIIIKD